MWNFRGRGKRRVPGEMNSWERDYAAHLEQQKHEGVIVWWAYEAVKLKLADRTHYTPDFCLLKASGEIEFHEVKGFWQDDARVKIKVAAAQFPIWFVAVSRKSKKKPWEYEVF